MHIDFPVGHKRRREEGTPLLEAKFERHVKPHFDGAHVEKSVYDRSASSSTLGQGLLTPWTRATCLPSPRRILKTVSDQASLEQMSVKDFTDLFVTKA